MSERMKSVPKPSESANVSTKRAYLKLIRLIKDFERALREVEEEKSVARLKAKLAMRQHKVYMELIGNQGEELQDYCI